MIVKQADYPYLSTCLRNVRPEVAEAIVVVDQLDEVIEELAEKFQLRLVEHPWTGNFAEQRNLSIGYATQPWILVLDADELMAQEDVRTLKKILQSDRYLACELVQWNYTSDTNQERFIPLSNEITQTYGWKGYFPVPCVRAFRNRPDIRFSRRVHEMVDPTIPEERILRSDLVIHHLKALKSPEALLDAEVRYLGLLEKEIEEQPTAKAWCDRGTIQLFTLKNPKEAILSFHKALEIHPQFREAMLNLAVAYGQVGQWDAALALYQCLESTPLIEVNKAVCLVHLQRQDDARSLLTRAEQKWPDHQQFLKERRAHLGL